MMKRRSGFEREWIFSDEKWFELGGVQGNERMWVDKDEPYPQERYVGKAAHPPKIHVWGAISHTGRTGLHIHVGGINSDVYIDCMEKALLPALFEKSWLGLSRRKKYVFQYDGATCHSSHVTLKWLKEHLPANVTALPRAVWPANSPDLNPIELVWTHLQDRVIERGAQTVDELKEIVREEWWKIPQEQIQHLLSALPNKINECIDHKGSRFNKR
jgi:hypothetical protein